MSGQTWHILWGQFLDQPWGRWFELFRHLKEGSDAPWPLFHFFAELGVGVGNPLEWQVVDMVKGEAPHFLDLEQIIKWQGLKSRVIQFNAHLSKGSSGLKPKCTQYPTLFSGKVFRALSHGVIHFVGSVSFENLKMEVSDWLLKNFNQWESSFSS